MKIGILAVQGAFEEHKKLLDKIGVASFEIRKKSDLEQKFDGMILPGGESTVMGKLLRELDMFDTIKSLIDNGMAVFGTCAGLILLANKICNDTNIYFASMDFTAKRNAYGRQLGSFEINSTFADCGEIPMVFIRAPYIERVGDKVEILATVNNKIVAVRQKNCLATAFHPELTDDTTVHKYFISMIK